MVGGCLRAHGAAVKELCLQHRCPLQSPVELVLLPMCTLIVGADSNFSGGRV